MRDSLGNVIPAMTNPSPDAVKALQVPGQALRTTPGPQLRMAGPPVNPSPAATRALRNAAGGAVGVRGLGTALKPL